MTMFLPRTNDPTHCDLQVLVARNILSEINLLHVLISDTRHGAILQQKMFILGLGNENAFRWLHRAFSTH